MDELIQSLNSVLSKFPTIHVIYCWKLDNTAISIQTSVSDTYVLNKLLNVFYYGSVPWKCTVNNCVFSGPNENRVNLYISLNIEGWKDSDLKREVDYKLCLLKNTLSTLSNQ